MVELQRLQSDGTWYTLRTFESANAAYLWLGKWNDRKYRLVRRYAELLALFGEG